MFTGNWPKDMLDHRNTNTANNKFENLREATNAQNQQNRRFRGNATGFKGVYRTGPRFTDAKRFQAMIMVAGKSTFLGLFPNPEQAAAAYAAAAAKHFGEFARPK